jgi:hypothetical protein
MLIDLRVIVDPKRFQVFAKIPINFTLQFEFRTACSRRGTLNFSGEDARQLKTHEKR